MRMALTDFTGSNGYPNQLCSALLSNTYSSVIAHLGGFSLPTPFEATYAGPVNHTARQAVL